jgi:hypothetical protein
VRASSKVEPIVTGEQDDQSHGCGVGASLQARECEQNPIDFVLLILESKLHNLNGLVWGGFEFPAGNGFHGGANQHRTSADDPCRLDRAIGPYGYFNLDCALDVHALGEFWVSGSRAGDDFSLWTARCRVVLRRDQASERDHDNGEMYDTSPHDGARLLLATLLAANVTGKAPKSLNFGQLELPDRAHELAKKTIAKDLDAVLARPSDRAFDRRSYVVLHRILMKTNQILDVGF